MFKEAFATRGSVLQPLHRLNLDRLLLAGSTTNQLEYSAPDGSVVLSQPPRTYMHSYTLELVSTLMQMGNIPSMQTGERCYGSFHHQHHHPRATSEATWSLYKYACMTKYSLVNCSSTNTGRFATAHTCRLNTPLILASRYIGL